MIYASKTSYFAIFQLMKRLILQKCVCLLMFFAKLIALLFLLRSGTPSRPRLDQIARIVHKSGVLFAHIHGVADRSERSAEKTKKYFFNTFFAKTFGSIKKYLYLCGRKDI